MTMTVREVAEALGCSKETVRTHLRDLGFEMQHGVTVKLNLAVLEQLLLKMGLVNHPNAVNLTEKFKVLEVGGVNQELIKATQAAACIEGSDKALERAYNALAERNERLEIAYKKVRGELADERYMRQIDEEEAREHREERNFQKLMKAYGRIAQLEERLANGGDYEQEQHPGDYQVLQPGAVSGNLEDQDRRGCCQDAGEPACRRAADALHSVGEGQRVLPA